MRTDDIDGASPCKNKFLIQSSRRTNPLIPDYKLPSVSSLNYIFNQSVNYSFIRDNLCIKDIEGTSAKPRNWSH